MTMPLYIRTPIRVPEGSSISPHPSPSGVSLVAGPRQSGRTTWLLNWLEADADEYRILLVRDSQRQDRLRREVSSPEVRERIVRPPMMGPVHLGVESSWRSVQVAMDDCESFLWDVLSRSVRIVAGGPRPELGPVALETGEIHVLDADHVRYE